MSEISIEEWLNSLSKPSLIALYIAYNLWNDYPDFIELISVGGINFYNDRVETTSGQVLNRKVYI